MKQIAGILIVVIVAGTLSRSQQTIEWKGVVSSASGDSEFQFNMRRLTILSSGMRETWTRQRFTKPHKENYEERVMRTQFNCGTLEMRTLEMIYYDRYGNTISHRDFSEDGSDIWVKVAPQSIGEAMLTAVCNQPDPALDELYSDSKPKAKPSPRADDDLFDPQPKPSPTPKPKPHRKPHKP